MRFDELIVKACAAGTVAVAAFICLSCGVGGPEIKSINKNPAPSPTPTEREISGVFNVEGSAENETDPYKGVLNITNQGDIYGFRWTLNIGTRIGVGVQIGDATAASFASPSNGKGCGVVLYKIASDGSMEGRIANWGEDKFGTEKAVRTEGRTFAGKYQVTGTSPDGQQYASTLTIVKDGAGYDLEWSGEKPQVAFGTWRGSVAAASFGGRQCSFALYSIGGRDLDGVWGGQKAVTLGTEKAKRQ